MGSAIRSVWAHEKCLEAAPVGALRLGANGGSAVELIVEIEQRRGRSHGGARAEWRYVARNQATLLARARSSSPACTMKVALAAQESGR